MTRTTKDAPALLERAGAHDQHGDATGEVHAVAFENTMRSPSDASPVKGALIDILLIVLNRSYILAKALGWVVRMVWPGFRRA